MKIIDLLRQFDIPFKQYGEHHHCTEGWIQIECPFCSPNNSRKFRMGINIAGKYCSCWTCGPHNFVKTISVLTNQSVGQAHRLANEIPSTYLPPKDERPIGKYQPPSGMTHKLLPAHKQYLKSRKFDPKKLQHLWKLGSIGIAPRLQWRLFIPIIYRGEPQSFTTRAIDEDVGQRYITAESYEERIPCKNLLYGFDYVRHAVIICEGPTDVWRMGPGAVCTLGTTFTQAQVNHLVDIPVRVVCYDSEPDAQRQASRLVDMLSAFPGSTYNVVLDSKDPGAASAAEIKAIRRRFLQ